MFLDNLKKIGGNLYFAFNDKETDNDNFKDIISNLEYIGGALAIISNNGISSFGNKSFLNSVKKIDGKDTGQISINIPESDIEFVTIIIDKNKKINKLELNNLVSTGSLSNKESYLAFDNNDDLDEISFPKLTNTSKNFISITGNKLLTNINFNMLKNINKINIVNNNSLQNLNKFSSLETISFFLVIQENNKLNNIQFPNLKELGVSGENVIRDNADSIENKSAVWTENPSAPIDISAQ